jgi:hypothetical protein
LYFRNKNNYIGENIEEEEEEEEDEEAEQIN